ncbi:hypothetical protein [Paraflavitalea speifideaquila]|uniref:hypothetical protein n=1 Tax=Paraflavitalea speifideaquila TaxID=3076558 RepID=UPI0028F03781|nr:hypothetical protein [Paraflavitalea speifideiaquila]
MQYLVDSFSREELIASTDHPIPMIRILAFEALLRRKDPSFLAFLSATFQIRHKWYGGMLTTLLTPLLLVTL